MNPEEFQKELAIIQVKATTAVALGTVLIALGITAQSAFATLQLNADLAIKTNIAVYAVIGYGLYVLIHGAVVAQRRIKKLKLE